MSTKDICKLVAYCATLCCSLTIGEKVNMAYSLATALQWAHQKLVVHQDVHAGNILQTLDGKGWRLADFGSAGEMCHENGLPEQLKRSM